MTWTVSVMGVWPSTETILNRRLFLWVDASPDCTFDSCSQQSRDGSQARLPSLPQLPERGGADSRQQASMGQPPKVSFKHLTRCCGHTG